MTVWFLLIQASGIPSHTVLLRALQTNNNKWHWWVWTRLLFLLLRILVCAVWNRLVSTAKQMSGSSLETALFKTRSGTRQGVIEHEFRVETHRELASWTIPLIQGVNAAVLAVKELSTRKWKSYFTSLHTSLVNKKLSYHRGTAQCTVLVSSCCVSQGMGVTNFSVSKSDLQRHWHWCHTIDHIRFPFSLPWQLCLYLAPFPRYCHLFPKI